MLYKKYNYENVSEMLKERNFLLLDETYINVNSKMNVIHSNCGEVFQTTLVGVLKGTVCRCCALVRESYDEKFESFKFILESIICEAARGHIQLFSSASKNTKLWIYKFINAFIISLIVSFIVYNIYN